MVGQKLYHGRKSLNLNQKKLMTLETNLSPADYRKPCLLRAKEMLKLDLIKMATEAAVINHEDVFRLMAVAAEAGFRAGVNAHADAITPEFTTMMITLAEMEVEA